MSSCSLLVIACAAVLVACAGPAPSTASAASQPPAPGCSACLLENPGDVRPCVKLCHQPESDLGGADAGGVIR
jgi:hypothetical protein